MKNGWFDNFISSLERLIEKPPYLIFVFIGSAFLIISLITGSGYDRSWIFLLYSVGGMMWRYAEKDLVRPLRQKYSNADFWIRVVYHMGNLALFIGLLITFIKISI